MAPEFTESASITGDAEVGETLTSDHAVTGEPAPDITYEWHRCQSGDPGGSPNTGLYLQPGGVFTYLQPDGVSRYLRP